MSRRNRRTQPNKSTAASRTVTKDSFANFEARLGIQANNQSAGGQYTFDYTSRNRMELEAMYRSSWVCGVAVDCVAEDMTRAGIEINSQLPPDDVEKLTRAIDHMRIWDGIADTIKWARLYGGAIGVLLIEGQDMSTPLRPETVGRDQFKGLLSLDRWLLSPVLSELVRTLGPDLGKPMYYEVIADCMALPRMKIHYSRVVRIDGQDLPYFQKMAENLWGQSILERLIDRLMAFDSTTQGAAQLVFKAHLRTVKIKNYREIIAMGGKPLEGLVKSLDNIRRFQTNEGLTILDSEDEFESQSYTFSGLDNLLMQFGQQVCGALQIPSVRLFGESPAGLGGNGDTDIRNYYDNIKQQQERRVRSPLEVILQVASYSVLGRPLPEGTSFEFKSLWQTSDTEKSTIAVNTTQAVSSAYEAQIIDRSTALKELRQASQASGVFSQISDEDIEQAENEPPPGVGEMPPLPGMPGVDGAGPVDTKGLLDRLWAKFKAKGVADANARPI